MSVIALRCYLVIMKKGSGSGGDVAVEPLPADERPRRYPEYLMPIAGQLVRDAEFAEARAEFLAGYAFNTARAYWSDLDDVCMWASEREKDVLALTDQDVKAYVRLLRRRGYAANTIRRRRTALRGLYESLKRPHGEATARVVGSKVFVDRLVTGPLRIVPSPSNTTDTCSTL
jgi:hypothetical protein